MKKRLSVLALFIVTINFSIAQKPRVYIADILKTNILNDQVSVGYNGEKVSLVFTYNPEIYDQLVKKIPADKLDYVIKYSRRENYPAGLKNIAYYDYAALKPAYIYYVTELELNGTLFTLLEMPAAENKKMPEPLRPQTDIYFLTYSYWTNPYFDLGGKKQYSKRIVSEKDKLDKEFTDFIKAHGNGMIDGSLYFKTTLPVPSLSKADYVKQFEAAQAIVAQKNKETEDAYIARKKIWEDNQQRRIDSLKTEKAKVLDKIALLSKTMNDDLAAGNLATALTRYRYWKIPVIFKDIEIQRTGILNNEHRYYTVTSRIEFVAKPGGVDLIDETVFSATMNTGKYTETNKETFLHAEKFLQEGKSFIFKNAKGDRYLEDGTTGTNHFYQEPWNYFQEFANSYNNIPVVPSFEVINVNVDDEGKVFTVGVKMKMHDSNATVVYTPVDIYEELDRVSNFNLRIKNIQEEYFKE